MPPWMPLAGEAPAEVEIPADVVADPITLVDWLQAGGILTVAVLVAVLARRLAVRTIRGHDGSEGAARVAGRVVGYVVVLAGLIYALSTLEVRVGPLLGALGIGGLALALALQEILSNLVAGVLLQVRRPFHRGDQIITGDHEGTVLDVDLRVVTLRTFDGVVVFIPNSQVLANPIINNTRRPQRRTTLTVGVAYDTDLETAQRVIVAAVAGAEHVAQTTPPEAWVEQFGESSIDFAVRFWHAADIASMWRARSSAAMAVKAAFDEAGITIPFPQRTLWLGAGAETLRLTDGSPGRDGPPERDGYPRRDGHPAPDRDSR